MMGKEIFRIFFVFHMDPGIYIELTFVSGYLNVYRRMSLKLIINPLFLFKH